MALRSFIDFSHDLRPHVHTPCEGSGCDVGERPLSWVSQGPSGPQV